MTDTKILSLDDILNYIREEYYLTNKHCLSHNTVLKPNEYGYGGEGAPVSAIISRDNSTFLLAQAVPDDRVKLVVLYDLTNAVVSRGATFKLSELIPPIASLVAEELEHTVRMFFLAEWYLNRQLIRRGEKSIIKEML